jgi:deoxyribonuclease (pyrimidine dimer)
MLLGRWKSTTSEGSLVLTRINLVEPTELTDQHLVAEYREIRLLTALLQRTLKSARGFVPERVPDRFTLNKGHVYFFFDKGAYIHKRYDALREEMIKRGMSPQHEFQTDLWPTELYNDWEPSEVDKEIVRARIKERIDAKPDWYRHTKY